MAETEVYKCGVCGTEVSLEPGADIPKCCGQKMLRDLPVCEKQTVAEHYRMGDDNEPCDDGREGIKK